MTAQIREALQSPSIGQIIELWSLDASHLGAGVYLFSPEPVSGAPPRFGGAEYAVLPFEAEGFEWSGSGPAPQPSLRFLTAGGAAGAMAQLLGLIEAYGDLYEAKIARRRTFRKHLDDGAEPDPSQFIGPEEFLIQQLSSRTPEAAAFRLRSALDLEGESLPRRLATPTCPFAYRTARPDGSFEYGHVLECEYAGAAMFDAQGQSVTEPAKDVCGKRLSDCRARFGTSRIPFGGLPGLGLARAV